jgi:hypothetical protein
LDPGLGGQDVWMRRLLDMRVFLDEWLVLGRVDSLVLMLNWLGRLVRVLRG